MDSLDLSTHQFILNELATTLASQAASGKLAAGDLAVLTAPAAAASANKARHLSLADVRTQVGLADFCAALAAAQGPSAFDQIQPVLGELRTELDCLLDASFQESFVWHGWAPPDQLAYGLVLGLLRVARDVPSARKENVQVIIQFAQRLAEHLAASTGETHAIATCFVPAFHGLYRAVADQPFSWAPAEFVAMSKVFRLIGSSTLVLRRLNDALVILPEQEAAYDQATRATRRRTREQTDDAASATTFLTNSDEESLAQDETTFEDKADESAFEYRAGLLAYYERSHRPLSGYFVLCASAELLTSILSQVLAVNASVSNGGIESTVAAGEASQSPDGREEDATTSLHSAWTKLLTFPTAPAEDGELADELAFTLRQAGQVYHNTYRFVLNEQVKEHGAIAAELYSLEILSETLKLSVLASVGQARTNPHAISADVDVEVFNRLRTLLSEQAGVYEPVLQSAALQCTGILALNFPGLEVPLTAQIRRFVTTPLTMFDPLPGKEDVISPILVSAAKALRSCVTAHGDKDLVVSTVYTLLNYLGRDTSFTSGGISTRSGYTRTSMHQSVLASRTEEQKAAITANTLAVVSRLALEVGTPEVISLTLSMLLQRLRAADGYTEGVIMLNIIPLATAGSKHSFIEVVRAFTSVLRSTLAGGIQRRDSEAAHVALFKLARSLKQPSISQRQAPAQKPTDDEAEAPAKEGENVPDPKVLFLVELLQLFNERGKQVQTATSQRATGEELAELQLEMARLLPTIAELLTHSDLNPQLNPTLDMVALFRNMWFLAVLFNLANPQAARGAAVLAVRSPESITLSVSSVIHPASDMFRILALVALKTPTLVPETARNYIESELEYNSVLKRDFGSSAIESQREQLAKAIPGNSLTIKTLKPPEVIFLLTIYNVEIIRSSLGRPSMVLWYFVNDGLNASRLETPMESIAVLVVQQFLQEIRSRMADHSVDPRVVDEIQNLFLGAAHRIAKVREISRRFLDTIFGAYPALLCDPKLIVVVLEMLTLLRRGCEAKYTDEYMPVYHFVSPRAGIAFDLSDDYTQREDILRAFLQLSRKYLSMALAVAPVELKSLLEEYLSDGDGSSSGAYTELGKSVAAEMARSASVGNRQESFLPPLGGWRADASSSLFDDLIAKSNYGGEVTGIHLALTRQLAEMKEDPSGDFSDATIANVKSQLVSVARATHAPEAGDLRRLLYRTAALIVALPHIDFDLIHYLVSIPVHKFDPVTILTASHTWSWVLSARPAAESKLMTELTLAWSWTIQNRKGLFSPLLTSKHPFLQKTEMSAFDRNLITAELHTAKQLFQPHLILMRLISSRYQAFQSRDPAMALTMARLLDNTTRGEGLMSTHPLSREVRFLIVHFGLRVLQGGTLDVFLEYQLRRGLYRIAFGWFGGLPSWSFGSNRLQVLAELRLMKEVLALLNQDQMAATESLTSFPSDPLYVRLGGHLSVAQVIQSIAEQRQVLILLVENEVARYSVWSNPLNTAGRGSDYVGPATSKMTEAGWVSAVRIAWKAYPAAVVQMVQRLQVPVVATEAGRLVRAEPWKVVDCSTALPLFTENSLQSALKEHADMSYLLYWAPVSPVEAVELFQPKYGNNSLLLQYAMKTLKHHPVDLTFFYVPQIVQALRSDPYGYVEQFVFEQSKISQLFCHQIIWNMRANSYKDDDATIEDSLKPTLDRMVDSIVNHLSGQAQEFYEREFSFFNEVTDISGKLKPYIKKSKAEKKAKIDEEMAKIKVDQGVYLPSNPDGVVVDLARKSGRPLQSHAKAPFMATFKVRRDVARPGAALDENGKIPTMPVDVWQSAIFKVGDDCRQDVLALQIIAMFKNIFTNAGLDLYLNPYRVTATGPGTGVIDVVPNATSRDEMGRAQVNDLYAWFLSTFGNPDSISFQKARVNFIQSMAGYSLATYIAQVRDRHNGNIMIDGEGHLVHIDFGFLFDIGPGGMRFEPDSFKLTGEMIEVMGGGKSQGFKLFSELVVKGFLAIREYAEDVIAICHLMLPTDLPSFKGEPTIGRLRDRFKLDLTPREAAKYAEGLISNAYENRRATAYDELQYIQNGIPSKR